MVDVKREVNQLHHITLAWKNW